MSFEMAGEWEVENFKADLYDEDEWDDDFVPKLQDKQINKVLNGYDFYDCVNKTKGLNRQIGVFIYKDKTLNPFEIDYYDIRLQTTGNGQKFVLNGTEWTSISKSEKPEDFEDFNIYQMTARIKKINILLFAVYPVDMDEYEEDKELKALLGSFKTF